MLGIVVNPIGMLFYLINLHSNRGENKQVTKIYIRSFSEPDRVYEKNKAG